MAADPRVAVLRIDAAKFPSVWERFATGGVPTLAYFAPAFDSTVPRSIPTDIP